jgi:hypothetical protein
MRVDCNSQRVGIGTSSLNSVLTLASPANVSGITVESVSAGNSHFPHGNNWHYLTGNGAIFRRYDGLERMRIDFGTGYVGIGTNSPDYPLHILTSAHNVPGGYYYMNPSKVGLYSGSGSVPYSIRTEGRIACPEFNAYSDIRIKQDPVLSEASQDLSQLMRLEIREYEFKDKPGLGFGKQKGLIAQELLNVVPEAVTESRNVVPDIFKTAKIVALGEDGLELDLEEDFGLEEGEMLRIMVGEDWEEKSIAKVEGTKLWLAEMDRAPEKMFVYGRRVNDFLSVDYNKIFCLGLSATQEIYRKHLQLEQENAQLKARMEKLEAWVQSQGNQAFA